jgi:hypothetical protein
MFIEHDGTRWRQDSSGGGSTRVLRANHIAEGGELHASALIEMARLLRLGDSRLRLGGPPQATDDVAERLRQQTYDQVRPERGDVGADVAALLDLATQLREHGYRRGPTPARIDAIDNAVARGVISHEHALVLRMDGCVPDRLWEPLSTLIDGRTGSG